MPIQNLCMIGRGVLRAKDPMRTCCQHGSPYKMQNLVYEWVDISKFSQIWAKSGSNSRKFLKNLAILLKILLKIGLIDIWMGHFFLKNWYFYGSTFKFRRVTSLPKPNLSTPHWLHNIQPRAAYLSIPFHHQHTIV